MPSGSGNTLGSHSKSVQWNSRIQKQSKWKTLERDVAFGHAVDERVHRLLVVVGREARREPEAVRPLGHERRPAGEPRVAVEHLGGRRPGDHEVLERLARDRELHLLDRLGSDLERDVPRVVHEHAVPAVREVERHVLVGLLAGRAAVGVPDVDGLPVLHERPEPFAEPVDELADAERELGVQVRRGGRPAGRRDAGDARGLGGDRRIRRELEVSHRLVAARRVGAVRRARTRGPTAPRGGCAHGASRRRRRPRPRPLGDRRWCAASVSIANPGSRRAPRWCSTRTRMTPSAGLASETVSIGRLRVSPRVAMTFVGAATTSSSPSTARSYASCA